MTSMFFLHLHNQKGEREREKEREADDGCCLLWLLCGCCRFGGGEQWNRLRLEQMALNRNVWFGLGCLWTDGPALQRGKFNKRQSEKTERVRGRGKESDRTHLYIIPGWFESLRNKGITLDGLNVLYPSHLFLQRSSLWNTLDRREMMNKSTDTCTHMYTDTQTVRCPLSWSERHQISFGLGLVDGMLSLCIMLFDTHNIKYQIFPYFNLGLHKRDSCLAKGTDQLWKTGIKKSKQDNSQTVNYTQIMHSKIIKNMNTSLLQWNFIMETKCD